jgi:hypothetical protein
LPTPDVAVAASPSPTPRRMHNLWNWQRPDQCQFLATEVSRDFIPPCPAQISPAQVAALGPAISSRCGTLATNSMTNLEQRTCQITRLPQRRAHAHTASDNQSRSFGQVRKERLGNAGKSSSPLPRDPLEIAKHASQYAGRIACTGTALPEAAVFEADCTECKRRSSARAADQSGGVAFACAERAATIFRIITIKRF